MAWQLARAFRDHGHDVSVIVPFPSRPKGVLYPGYRRTFRQVESIDEVRVVRCANWLVGRKRRPWDRVLANVTFGLTGALAAGLERRPDVLILETWPLAAAQICMWEARLRDTPVLYYVKDVYPEAAENSGLLTKDCLLARVLRAWDRHLCLVSDKVVVISGHMREMMLDTRALPPDRVAVIPDWIDEREFRPLPRENGWRREMGLQPEAFVVLFAGNIGIVSGADVLIEAAERLRRLDNVLFLCVGEGLLKDDMMRQAKLKGLSNVRFEPVQGRLRVPEMHAAADVCLLTMRKDSANFSVPSKLVTYMAAGRPVLCATPSGNEVARIVSEAKAGIVVPPGDADALAEGILHLYGNPQMRVTMGANARSYFERVLAFDQRYEQFMEIVTDIVARRRRRAAEEAASDRKRSCSAS
jgi:colanic acid biosynthesis glycosyl transferase WcaI